MVIVSARSIGPERALGAIQAGLVRYSTVASGHSTADNDDNNNIFRYTLRSERRLRMEATKREQGLGDKQTRSSF